MALHAQHTDDPVEKLLIACKVKLFFKQAFLGNIISRLPLEEVTWCKTAATDGRKIYWNREFFKNLTPDQAIFVLAHEVYHCFPAGTIIPGDFKPIEDYQVGDGVIGVNGNHSTVVHPMSRQYDGVMVDIKARGMLSLPMTDEHPVLISRPTWKHVTANKSPTKARTNIREWSEPEWVNSIDVKAGDWVQIPRVKGNVTDHVMNFEFSANPWSSPDKIRAEVVLDTDIAEFLGYYVSEGCTSTTNGDHHTALAFNIKEVSICERIKSILNDKFGVASSIRTFDNSCQLQFSSAPLGKWLLENCGKGSHAKRIPHQILYNTDLDVLKAFLRSYTTGDGWVGDYGVRSATVSNTLALQLQLAWARFGVCFNLIEDHPKPSVIRGKPVIGGKIYRGHTSSQIALDFFDFNPVKKRPTKYARVTDDAIFVPVTKVTKRQFSGMVYNIETSCHTYAAGNMITHNCIFDHVGRRGNREPQIFNMACDFNINYSLVNDKIGDPPGCILHDKKYTDEMSVFEIYDLLIKNSVTIEETLDTHLEVSSGDDDEDDGDGDGDDGDGDQEGDGKGKRKVKVTVLGKDGPPKLTEEDLEKIRRELRSIVIDTATTIGADSIPKGMRRMIQDLVEPQIDWRSLLDTHIRSAMKDDYSFQRISRRSHSIDAILPGQSFATKTQIFCAIDASGSTTPEMVRDFLSEVNGIAQSFTDFEIDVICFDATVYNHKKFTPENSDEIGDYEIQGGGGTSFEEVFAYMKREGLQPERLCILTDGYPNDTWGDPNYCDTIFVIHGNEKIRAPYGVTAYYKPKGQQ